MRRFLSGLPTPALLSLAYSTWIAIGTLLLLLPVSATSKITLSDAFFTATSAATVTGLIVVDTGTVFSFFGQLVITVLMQLGGMGLMTFAVLMLSSLGMRIGLTPRTFLRQEMGTSTPGSVLELIRVIAKVVVIGELAGALLMMTVFVPEFGWVKGSWQAIFHSISAFNNAGFSLFPDSLMSYVDNPVIILTVSLQFIIGGLGFAVLVDILERKGWLRYTLHTRMMLTGTLALIIIGVVSFAILEWHNPLTLGGLFSLEDKLLAAWFEGVTPRTAGFNSLNTGAMYDSTSLMTIIMMIVGGGSTSTAGGIKVTTAVVLLMATFAFFRNTGQMHAYGYSIGLEQGLKVMALLTVSTFVILSGLSILIITHDLDFLDALFEVASAFGTVGLSHGITAELNGFGRFIICIIMFLGRVGPLTLGFMLATKTPPRVKYPDGAVYLG